MINPVYSYSLHPPNRQSEASYPGWALLDQRPTLAGRPEWEANALRFTAVVSSFCYFRPVHGRSEDQLPMASSYPCFAVLPSRWWARRHCLRKDLATSQAVQHGADFVCQRTVITKAKETPLEAKAPKCAATVRSTYCMSIT